MKTPAKWPAFFVAQRHGPLLHRRYDFVKSAQPRSNTISAERDKDGNEPERRQPILPPVGQLSLGALVSLEKSRSSPGFLDVFLQSFTWPP